MRKLAKRCLALLLAAIMMFGSSLNVLAETTDETAVSKGVNESCSVFEGDEVTLEAKAYDASSNYVDFSTGNYTFEWRLYYCYYDENGECQLGLSGILGTEESYTFNAQEEDFYSSTRRSYNRYLCDIYLDGTYQVTSRYYIYEIEPIVITSQPESKVVSNEGDEATLSVTAESYDGGSLSYCWYYRNPGAAEFKPSGVYESSVTVPVTSARDGRQMYCVITDTEGNSVTSDTVTLSIYEKVYISVDETKELTVSKNGDYVWLVFVPEESGCYQITSVGDYHPISALMDANCEEVFGESWGSGSSIVHYCEAGETYLIRSYLELSCSNEIIAITVNSYDINSPYGTYSADYYAFEGDSLTLTAYASNYNGGRVDLDENTYTFEWHKVYNGYDENNEYYDYVSDVLGTGKTLAVDEVDSTDFYLPGVSWNQYECYIYLNGEKLFASVYYIFDNNYVYSSNVRWMSGIEGRTLTLEATAYDYNGESADLTDEAFTFQWYKYYGYYDNEFGEWCYDSVELAGTEASCVIDEAVDSDFYGDENNVYNYYYCIIYKNGVEVTSSNFYIERAEAIVINTQPQSIAVFEAGDDATLTVEAMAYDGGTLTYQWYYLNPGAADFKSSGCYESSVTVPVTAARSGRQMYCVITDSTGYSVTTDTVTLTIMEKSDIELDETKEVTIAESGEYNYLVFVPEESGYYVFWSDNSEGYDPYGYLLDSNGNYLTSNSYSGTDDNYSMVYYCTAGESYVIRSGSYSEGEITFTVTVNTFDAEAAYYGVGEGIFALEGESVALTARAKDYFYKGDADLTDGTYTFEWYSTTGYYSDDTWTYETSDILSTEQTYTIDITSSDFYYTYSDGDIIHYNYCKIYRNGVYSCTSYYYIYNGEGVYWSTTQYLEGTQGTSLTLEAELVDYKENSVDLSEDAYTFQWYRIIDAYDAQTDDWNSGISEVLGTDAIYEIAALSSDDFQDEAHEIYNHYRCDIYKDGTYLTSTYFYITEKKTELEITTQPVDVVVETAGDKAVLTVEAQGDGLTYSWYYKNPGATSFSRAGVYTSSVTVPVTAARDGREMYCVITDIYGNTVTTNTATVSIKAAAELKITAQPVDVVVENAGDEAVLTVEAQGDGLTYSWYYKNPGATSFSRAGVYTSSVTVPVTKARDGRQMYCMITDAYGNTVATNMVTLSIQSATELKIITQPVDVVVENAGDEAVLTVEAQGDGLTYSWYYKNPGATSFSRAGVYTSSVTVPVTVARNGREMYCVITDAYGNSVTTDTVTMSIAAKLTITSQPVDTSVASAGDDAVLTVEAEGYGLTYCWYYKNPRATSFSKSGVYTSSVTVPVTTARSGRQMYCIITDAFGNTVTTNIVTLSIAD